MGNHRFRLSNMMPNTWFYKLKDLSKVRNPSSTNKMIKTSNHDNNNLKKQQQQKKKKTTTKKKHQNPNHGSASSSASASQNSIRRFQPMSTSLQSLSHSLSRPVDGPLTPTTAFTLHSYPVNSPDPPRASYQRKTIRKAVYRPSPNPRFGSQSQRLIAAHWRRSLWTDDDLNISPPDHYFASPAPPTDADGYGVYESSSPDHEGSNSSSDKEVASSWSWSNCNCKIISSSPATTTDIIIHMNHEYSTSPPNPKNPTDRNTTLEPELPPISTRQGASGDTISSTAAVTLRNASFKLGSSKQHNQNARCIEVDQESFRSQTNQNFSSHIARKSPSGISTGIKLRTNGSRAAGRKMQAARARRSTSSSSATGCSDFNNKNLTSSFAIAKLSVDPRRDFKESMEEMITGHNIRASKDLEDLLACYLSLNPRQYHDHIIRAFEDIWFDNLR